MTDAAGRPRRNHVTRHQSNYVRNVRDEIQGSNTRSPVLADCLTSPSTSQERSKFGLSARRHR